MSAGQVAWTSEQTSYSDHDEATAEFRVYTCRLVAEAREKRARGILLYSPICMPCTDAALLTVHGATQMLTHVTLCRQAATHKSTLSHVPTVGGFFVPKLGNQ